MANKKIFFRADGHAKMGLGHIIRSVALADMLKGHFECHFIGHQTLAVLESQILATCQTLLDLPTFENKIAEANYLVKNVLTGEEIVVLDGYFFKTEYQQILKNHGCRVVCIDDIFAYHFVADVVINHAGGLQRSQYSLEDYTRCCFGLKYALLRKPFRLAAQNRVYQERDEQAIFICLGGADPNNDTLEVLQKCEQSDDITTCYVVMGGAYLYREALEQFIAESPLKINLLSNLNAEEMVFYMKKCGVAITPPSTISFEYLSLGGTLFLKVIADNQLSINKYFLSEKLAFDFEKDFGNISEDSKKEALEKQAQYFDGQTEKRFLTIFQQLNN